MARVPLVVTAESESIVGIKHSLSIFSSFEGDLGCLGGFATANRRQDAGKRSFRADIRSNSDQLGNTGLGADPLTEGLEWSVSSGQTTEVTFKKWERRDYLINGVG